MAASARSAFDDLATQTAIIGKPQRVLFILSMRGGKILASGIDTAADGILKLAGAENAIQEFSGYKALSEEAIITSAPDAILMMARGGDHSADADKLFAHPAISQTPAAASRSLIKMDGLYLLGFGPRTPAAATDLYKALYEAGAAAN